jgi:predicted O-linked N-acetylglucosamine transferase (SPINDLY family)
LNNFCKINQPLFAAWAQILGAVPGSRLTVHTIEGDHRQRTLKHFADGGIAPERIMFVGRVPRTEYFQSYQALDITLDTTPYAGGTTTCDSLWMGVPVVTLAGERAVGRGGVSLLHNVGLPELIADSLEEYVQIAVALAKDLPRLRELRSTLRARMQASPLMDAPRFARSVEAAYRQMWRVWCKGK